MYGYHEVPLEIQDERFSLSLRERDGDFLYQRKIGLDLTEKAVISRPPGIFISPVEPFYGLKRLASHLLIEIDTKIILEPYLSRKVYLTFPVDIGVFISDDGKEKEHKFDLLDIFSPAKNKLTLYGNVSNGVLCRYWRSNIFFAPPPVNPSYEGVLTLTITNRTDAWTEISRLVLSAEEMRMFFSAGLVISYATMNVIEDGAAETAFDEHIADTGMEEAIKVFASRKLPVITTGFIMEHGI